MKKISIAAIISLSLFSSVYAADFNLGVSGSENGISGFGLSVGDYYRAPIEEVRIVRRSLPSEELSVVYYLARKSHKSPEYITKMRLDRHSWWDIAIALRLDPQVVYVAQAPRGKAYGYYKNKKHDRLKDGDVIEIVNTRFLSSYYGVSADEIYEKRNGGRGYDAIDEDYRGKKHKKEKGPKAGREDGDRHGNGHGHGKDRD